MLSFVVMETDTPSIKKFLGPMKPDFPIIRADQDAPEAYNISAIPCNILVGPDGTILERMEGSFRQSEWNEKVIPHILKQS